MKLTDSELYELYELAIALADSAARSDIECMALQVDGWYEPVAAYNNDEEIAGVATALRYISLREASGETMPYKVVRDGDKVRFE